VSCFEKANYARSPVDKCPCRHRALEPLPGDAQGRISRRAIAHDHCVIHAAELRDLHVLSNSDVAEKVTAWHVENLLRKRRVRGQVGRRRKHPWSTSCTLMSHLIELCRNILGLCVVGGYTIPNQAWKYASSHKHIEGEKKRVRVRWITERIAQF